MMVDDELELNDTLSLGWRDRIPSRNNDPGPMKASDVDSKIDRMWSAANRMTRGDYNGPEKGTMQRWVKGLLRVVKKQDKWDEGMFNELWNKADKDTNGKMGKDEAKCLAKGFLQRIGKLDNNNGSEVCA